MKSMFTAALAVLLLSAAPALAQYRDVNAVIAGIGGSSFLSAAQKIDGASSVQVVRLSTLLGASGGQAGRLYSVAALKQRDINYLQSSLVINPIAMTAIRNSGFSLRDIVSATMNGDNSAVIYANDL